MDRDTRLWHPFAQMGIVRSNEFMLEKADDVWLWDTDGRRYFDGTASLWYCNVGHGRQEIRDAIVAQLDRLEAYSTFGDFTNEPARELARRLAEYAPMEDAKVFLASGGGDGVDTAVKLARRYWHELGQPQRTHVLSRTHGYHGTHGYGTALAGIEPNRSGFGPVHADTAAIPYDSADELEAAIERIGPDRVAAFFVEPVVGAGGVYPPPDGYIEAVARICDRTGVLLVCDAVICGFGRLGTWYGIERWDVEPDMIVFAKGVTSGYQPVGGLVVSGKVAEPFWGRPDAPAFRHGATYAGHATCCAAGLANLNIMEREGLVGRGRELEGDLLACLAALDDHPLSAGARGGIGMMAAMELDHDLLAERPTAVLDLFGLVRERGVLVRPLGSAIALSPPLTSTREHFELVTDALRGALDALAEMGAPTTA